MAAAGEERYSAFISYSHADTPAARWLHRTLEGFRLPRALIGQATPFGPAPARLPPVFRDRDELPASADLGGELRAALAAARFQIVLCSPRSARSIWVNEEILSFKRLHGEARVLPVILAGEPYSGGDQECFPQALRFRLAADGSLSDVPAEPIAADLRDGKDGRRLALLKLVAGITGLPLDALAQRDAARRQRRLMAITAASLTVTLVTIGLAIYANIQRRDAVRQRQVAESSLDFLINTFAIANPATENPRTITALTILERASKRAGAELPAEPLVSARLLTATGDIYLNLGLPKEGTRDLEAALAKLPATGTERARVLLRLAAAASKAGDTARSGRMIAAAEAAAGADDSLAAELAEQRGLRHWATGDYGLSRQELATAAAILRNRPGDQRAALARVLARQALTEIRLKRPAAADALYAQVEAIQRARLGPDHVDTATVMQNRAIAAFDAGRLADARRGIANAVAIYDRVLDPEHPTLAAALLAKGRILTAERDGNAAVAALERARGIFSRLYGVQSPAVGDTAFYTAEAHAARGDSKAALRQVALARTIYDRAYGPDDPDQAELLLLESRILAAAGRRAEAATACARALALDRRIKAEASVIADAQAQCRDVNDG